MVSFFKTNKGAACIMLAALCPVLLYILFSDWTFRRASDGFLLGAFPLAYLLCAMLFLLASLFDRQRDNNLSDIDHLCVSGLLRIGLLIVAGIAFAFLQERIGFVPGAFGLAVIAVLVMGTRSVFVIVSYALVSALMFFIVFYALGFSVQLVPKL